MPLPHAHRASLERHLVVHEERLAFLSTQLESLDRLLDGGRERPIGSPRIAREFLKPLNVEAMRSYRQLLARERDVHQALLELGRDSAVHDVLGELAEDITFAREASRDPAMLARERGIEVPDNMRLRLLVDNDRTTLHIEFYEELYPVSVIWDSGEGFSEPTVR